MVRSPRSAIERKKAVDRARGALHSANIVTSGKYPPVISHSRQILGPLFWRHPDPLAQVEPPGGRLGEHLKRDRHLEYGGCHCRLVAAGGHLAVAVDVGGT
jgi:hypothetical protein